MSLLQQSESEKSIWPETFTRCYVSLLIINDKEG